MTIKRERKLTIIILFNILLFIALLIVLFKQNKSIASVDAVKLFNEYNLKKELEFNDGKKLDKIIEVVDSVQNVINIASKDINVTQIQLEHLYSLLNKEQELYNSTFSKSNEQINEQVWKELNVLIKKYAMENNIDLIIGANGMGSVLYYNEKYDISDDVIKYVNNVYDNGN